MPPPAAQLFAAINKFRQAFVIAVGDKSPFAKLALSGIDTAIKASPATAANVCTRSHPHEEMNVECERLTEEARNSAAARGEKSLLGAIHCRLTNMGTVDEAALIAITHMIEQQIPELKTLNPAYATAAKVNK